MLKFLVDILFCVKWLERLSILIFDYWSVSFSGDHLSVSEWWLFCLSGGRSTHSCPNLSSESTVLKRTSLCSIAISLNVYL